MQLGSDLAIDQIRDMVWRRVRDAITAPVEVAMDALFDVGVPVPDVELRIGPEAFRYQLVVRRIGAVFEVVASFDMGGDAPSIIVTERWLVPLERIRG